MGHVQYIEFGSMSLVSPGDMDHVQVAFDALLRYANVQLQDRG